jgi:phthiocerol/phenolphthiocerol synthesis type-I polyketide synthase E
MDRDALDGIAIIGMAGRFPQAPTLQRFWENLCQGIESISFFSDEELEQAGVSPALLRHPNYVKAKAVLDDADLFDAGFFGYSPREAELTDPQIRIFLECAWEVLESAGWNPDKFPGMIGVYAGMSLSSYIWQIAFDESVQDSVNSIRILMGGAEKDHLATTISYRLNLRGPSFNLQTACSTSLAAVHAASRAVMTYECDMALAGAVSIGAPQRSGYIYEPGGILSADGHCRSFDAEASGSVAGEGIGVVLLKRLEDAIAAGDTVYAVIKGSAVNNDGRRKVGFTAPAIEGQAEAIAMALAAAEAECESIGYIETHGSATAIGDPIEIAALNQVYGQAPIKAASIPVGSVKSNIGHLNAASGVAGLIKTALAIRHGQIPPSLHFRQPNPRIPFERSPFRVNHTLCSWPESNKPRRAGISSFGIGGTNVHMILQEAPAAKPSDPAKPWQLAVISARTRPALERATDQLAAHVRENPDSNLADVAFTLQEGRKAFEHRRMVVCRDSSEAATVLPTRVPSRVFTAVASSGRRPVAFLLPGLGDQYLDMGRGLYESEPEFKKHVDRCSEFLQPLMGADLRKIMFPTPAVRQQHDVRTEERVNFRDLVSRARGDSSSSTAQEIHRTLWAQPALFVIEYALAKLWMSWGVVPESMLGYSVGEYAAACLAGVVSLEDSLRMLAVRARMIEDLAPGAMLAIAASEEEIRPLLTSGISIAGINGNSLCVVAATPEAINALQSRLAEGGKLVCRRLLATHAFHSPLMEPIAEELTRLARTIRLSPPKIRYISNVTGRWITDSEATDATYWARHLVQPVQFAAGLQYMCSPSAPVLLEVGPGQMLTSLAEQYLSSKDAADRVALASLPHSSDAQPDRAFILNTLGNLWLAGIEPDWAGVHRHEKRRRVPLPTYPFEQQRYWVTPTARPEGQQVHLPRARAVAAPFAQEIAPPNETHLPENGGVGNTRAALGAEYVAPTNSTEQKIVEIWEDLLGVHPVGIHDEFLRLGGNSLLAIRVAAELREAFQIEFPLEELLKSSTISEIALFVEDTLLTMIEGMDETEASGMENK